MSDWSQPVGHPRMPAGQPPVRYSPPAQLGPAAPPSLPPRGPSSGSRRGWPATLALVLVGVLLVVVGVQTWQLIRVSAALDEVNQRWESVSQGQAYADERLEALEGRAGELERQFGDSFDPEAIAASVIPSVFMVVAGEFSGTAFAIGPPTADGGTNLFTNFHVVEQVWALGGREVALERRHQHYPAEIVDVYPAADVAWLRVSQSFKGLTAAQESVRSGQPIVAVGAPHGLTDTVTTGVISSPDQRLPDGSGPWLQFDAAINPGNSGGPVINSNQEVVGIATAKRQEAEGLGFAVPIDTACGLFDVC